MEICGFVGESGSGKSFRALNVARELGIEHIIDDGLLIKCGKIMAGKSAKNESTRIASVKRALFFDGVHAQAVKSAIIMGKVERLMIIGTSLDMVRKICEQLELPQPHKFINIRDVATSVEIEQAKKMRKKMGTHVIPATTAEIKRAFSSYFTDPLKLFLKMPTVNPLRSIVRPEFSYNGKFTISTHVIDQICMVVCSKSAGVTHFIRSNVQNSPQGLCMSLDVELAYGSDLVKTAKQVRDNCIEKVEYMCGLTVVKMDVVVRKIAMTKEKRTI